MASVIDNYELKQVCHDNVESHFANFKKRTILRELYTLQCSHLHHSTELDLYGILSRNL